MYPDGTTVNWDQPEKNGAEPEYPVPSLRFAKAAALAVAVVSTRRRATS